MISVALALFFNFIRFITKNQQLIFIVAIHDGLKKFYSIQQLTYWIHNSMLSGQVSKCAVFRRSSGFQYSTQKEKKIFHF